MRWIADTMTVDHWHGVFVCFATLLQNLVLPQPVPGVGGEAKAARHVHFSSFYNT